MPELPEVECFARTLNEVVKIKEFQDVICHRKDLRYPLQTDRFKEVLKGKGLGKVQFGRYGKMLTISGPGGVILVSLGMSGGFRETVWNRPEKHEHVTLLFSQDTSIGYFDARRFGFWIPYKKLPERTFYDPLSEIELKECFSNMAKSGLKAPVKTCLMDQKRIGGVGNIYASEALFLAKIHPERPFASLRLKEREALAHYIPELLERAIVLGGSSISSYRSWSGDKGGAQDVHRVYHRETQKCARQGCGGVIQKVIIAARSTFFCAKCQN